MAQRKYILDLYRQILKNERDWLVYEKYYAPRWDKVREEFRKHKQEQSPQRIAVLIEKAERFLKENEHPDPYISMWSLLRFNHQK
jgi:hypothetical protein